MAFGILYTLWKNSYQDSGQVYFDLKYGGSGQCKWGGGRFWAAYDVLRIAKWEEYQERGREANKREIRPLYTHHNTHTHKIILPEQKQQE